MISLSNFPLMYTLKTIEPEPHATYQRSIDYQKSIEDDGVEHTQFGPGQAILP